MKSHHITVLSILSALSATVTAGQTTADALLKTPIILSNGTLLISSYGTTTGMASCASSSQRFAVDGTTSAGKVTAATIMMAYMAGKAVQLVGDGTCGVYAGSETIAQIRFAD